jgi:hypothetical protein
VAIISVVFVQENRQDFSNFFGHLAAGPSDRKRSQLFDKLATLTLPDFASPNLAEPCCSRLADVDHRPHRPVPLGLSMRAGQHCRLPLLGGRRGRASGRGAMKFEGDRAFRGPPKFGCVRRVTRAVGLARLARVNPHPPPQFRSGGELGLVHHGAARSAAPLATGPTRRGRFSGAVVCGLQSLRRPSDKCSGRGARQGCVIRGIAGIDSDALRAAFRRSRAVR